MTKTIRRELLIPQPREQVWRAITDSTTLAEWMFPNDFEPRVGHQFTFRVPGNPKMNFDGLVVRCEVLECEPPNENSGGRLEFSWSAGGPVENTRVSFRLEPDGDGTRILFEHSGFDVSQPNGEQAARGAEFGWAKMLKQLSAVIERSAAGRNSEHRSLFWEHQSMNKPSPKVDGYVRKSKEWQDELQELRLIILDCDLTEEVKWRVPCYTFQGSNVLFIGRFKDSCVLSFVKGALLKDAKHILIQQTENSQSVRVIRFTNVQQIVELEPVLKAYIREAIEVEKAGLKVSFKKISEFTIPEELETKFKEKPALKTAFTSLTPGRQRAYILHISSAKQSKTRSARVEKHVQRILKGKGIDDE